MGEGGLWHEGRKYLCHQKPIVLHCRRAILEKQKLSCRLEGEQILLATQVQQNGKTTELKGQGQQAPNHRNLVGPLEGITGEEEPEKRPDFISSR